MNLQHRTLLSSSAAMVLICLTTIAQGHVTWTQGHSVAPDTLALYHFNDADVASSDTLAVASGLSTDLGLFIGTTAGAGLNSSTDLPYPFLGAGSLENRSTQLLQSPGEIHGTDSDLTIDFWFKWDLSLTSQTLKIGLRSTAKVVISRDVSTPSNDRFGVEFTHHDYISAPGFTDWLTVGSEEASLDEWRHYGLVIHSTGMTFNPVSSHDEYNAGSTATLYINGHATGSHPHSFSIEGMRAHEHSKVLIEYTGGGTFIDEFSISEIDWSMNGTVSNPFANGRGATAAIENWTQFE